MVNPPSLLGLVSFPSSHPHGHMWGLPWFSVPARAYLDIGTCMFFGGVVTRSGFLLLLSLKKVKFNLLLIVLLHPVFNGLRCSLGELCQPLPKDHHAGGMMMVIPCHRGWGPHLGSLCLVGRPHVMCLNLHCQCSLSHVDISKSSRLGAQ